MTAPLLIADDSEGKIQMLVAALQAAQWKGDVLTATTTEQAMDLIRQCPEIGFGLIDYYIPSTNGPSVIRALKDANPHARIVLVSSSNNPDNTQEAMDAGAERSICTGNPSDLVAQELSDLLYDWMLE